MPNYEEINEALGNEIETLPEKVTVELITLSGMRTYEVEEGTTIKAFKEARGLSSDVKIVDEDGDVLRAEDTIETDIQLYISTPKKNG